MNKNYIFREIECGLSVEQTAELCLKTARTVKEWDRGKTIPPECKRLMRMVKGRELSSSEQWNNFRMHHDRLELPTGKLVTAQEVLTAIALLEIDAFSDVKTKTRLLKYVRCLELIKRKTSIG
ncbi:regulator [Vibrio sp. YIC-376]|uniref:regulator n=1 Tax=Vibrio sp. YIC-376 TaxID=3136162 RepID=UPI00402A70E7